MLTCNIISHMEYKLIIIITPPKTQSCCVCKLYEKHCLTAIHRNKNGSRKQATRKLVTAAHPNELIAISSDAQLKQITSTPYAGTALFVFMCAVLSLHPI